MGSYFRGENLSDFELDELNSGNDSGNDNTGRIYEFIPDSISKKYYVAENYSMYEYRLNVIQAIIAGLHPRDQEKHCGRCHPCFSFRHQPLPRK